MLTFISWAPHCSRSDGIAERLGGRSFMVYAGWLGSNYLTAPLKYFVQTVQTLWILLRHRPRAVMVMAPPIVACLPVWLYCVVFRAKFAIDAHTGAFLNPRWKRLQFIQRFFSRRAATTVVTNDYLRDMVRSWGAHATIVPDVPVRFPPTEAVDLGPGRHMTVVASFCPDEPILEVLEAARSVPDVNFYITGNSKKLGDETVKSAPGNVRFLGFLSRVEYTGQLLASDAVIALTTRDHTMQRAAYEAIYLGRPVITSDFDVLRKSFPTGTVHVQPVAAEIADGVAAMAADSGRYAQEAASLRADKHTRWETDREGLAKCLHIDSGSEACASEVEHSLEKQVDSAASIVSK